MLTVYEKLLHLQTRQLMQPGGTYSDLFLQGSINGQHGGAGGIADSRIGIVVHHGRKLGS